MYCKAYRYKKDDSLPKDVLEADKERNPQKAKTLCRDPQRCSRPGAEWGPLSINVVLRANLIKFYEWNDCQDLLRRDDRTKARILAQTSSDDACVMITLESAKATFSDIEHVSESGALFREKTARTGSGRF